jgi:uncharacterized protein Usg
MQKNKTVYILESGSCYSIPEKADEFMAFWQSELDKIPKEFMDSARIEFEFESDGHGYSSTSIKITYEMPESDIDAEVREQEELQRYQRDVDQKLMRYERLKKELNL